MTIDVIRYLFRYNAWATELALNAAELLSAADYDAPGCSGTGSVRETLAHVLMVQKLWIETIAGTLSADDAAAPAFSATDIPTVADARKYWVTVAATTDAYLASLGDELVLGEVSISHPRRGTLTAILWRLLLHVANHGTHHRAQIFAAVRRAGHAPGGSDLLYFMLSPGGTA